MVKIHILDLPPRHPLLPVPADWFPWHINKQLLSSLGLHFSFFHRLTSEFYYCDLAFVSSRFFELQSKTDREKEAVYSTLSSIKARCGRLFWFDFRDSSGCTQFEVLPYVDKYLKKQLLRDKTAYSRPLYGNRLYTDYIHRQFSINDTYKEPSVLLPPKFKHKLALSWNPGLLDFRGGTNPALALHLLTDKLASRYNFAPHLFWKKPNSPRRINMLALFNTNYARNTVAWQRRHAEGILDKLNDPKVLYRKKLTLAKEISARRSSKIVLSLFGWGEICSRDFQAFTAGATLIAPDTSHLETWPSTHLPHQTYYPIKWDLSDLPDAYHALIKNDELRQKIASAGQNLYKRLFSLEGRQAFCQHLYKIIESQPAPLTSGLKNKYLH